LLSEVFGLQEGRDGESTRLVLVGMKEGKTKGVKKASGIRSKVEMFDNDSGGCGLDDDVRKILK